MEPQVTVLTTVYNGMAFIREAIESTLNQTFTDFEFLIIDDASTDDSVECIRSYNDPRIRLIQNDVNIGQTASLNKGLLIAKGKYIARFDQDDVNLPLRLEQQVKEFENKPELTILCSWEHTIDHEGKRIIDHTGMLPNYGYFIGKILLGLCPVWHPSVMFKKDMILDMNGYDTFYGPAEDYELWSRIAIKRLNAEIVPKFHLLQRVHTNRQSNLQADKQLRATRLAHNKVVKNFNDSSDSDCIASILRLEMCHCGKSNKIEHIKNISLAISDMLKNINIDLSLTKNEYKGLKKVISKRIGKGILNAHKLPNMPASFFYLFLYSMSPLLHPSIRVFLSEIYTRVRKMRYFFSS